MADIHCIHPYHPLFEIIWRYAFNQNERMTLGMCTLKYKPVSEELVVITTTLRDNAWSGESKAVLECAIAIGSISSFNSALMYAAYDGQISAMEEAWQRGAKDFNTTLRWAARGGHIPAMWKAISMGAKCHEGILAEAARGGHIPAMRMARQDLKSLDYNEALAAAAEEGHIPAMKEALAMGATRNNVALVAAARAGQVLAMREARAMGAKYLNWALEEAAKAGHISAIEEALKMGATNVYRAREMAETDLTRDYMEKVIENWHKS
jgi:hypothetical protein